MFKSARIKLTLWYSLIILTLTLCFSAFVYSGVWHETQRALNNEKLRAERLARELPSEVVRPGPRNFPVFDEEIANTIRHRTLADLILVNSLILIVTAGLGYLLAGKTLKPIEQMVDKQKRFISDAAHEVKTPLAAMKTDLEVTIRDKNLTVEDAKETMNSTIEEINNLHGLTEQLLMHAKFQEGFMHNITKSEVSLNELVSKIIKKYDSLVAKDNYKIILEAPKEIKIIADKNSLERLFQNLIDNAVKYNSRKKDITIKIPEHTNAAVVQIIDQGDGIPEDEIKYIFEPFYRVDKSRSKNIQPGTGLGLAIAKEVAKYHNGSISVSSKLGHGSTFTVSLPLSDVSQRSKLN